MRFSDQADDVFKFSGRASPGLPPAGRILVVKLSSLGDLFHLLPAVHVLKRELQAEIDWVTQPEYAGLVACFKDVSRIIRYPRRRFAASAVGFIRALRAGRYDLIVDGQGLLKSALTAWMARGPAIIGPAYCREGAGIFYRLRPRRQPGGPRRHAVLEALDIVSYLGLRPGKPVFPLCFPDTRLPGTAPRIGLVSSSRWPSKNWPPPAFAKLAAGLHRCLGATIFMLDDRPSNVCRRLASCLPPEAFHDLGGKLDLPSLGGVLTGLDLVIANDTGPLHMAAAAGTPAVALFGPTDPDRTAPWGAGHRVLRADPLTDCAPCHRRRCPRGTALCMEAITVESVLAAARDVLQARKTSREV